VGLVCGSALARPNLGAGHWSRARRLRGLRQRQNLPAVDQAQEWPRADHAGFLSVRRGVFVRAGPCARQQRHEMAQDFLFVGGQGFWLCNHRTAATGMMTHFMSASNRVPELDFPFSETSFFAFWFIW